MKYTSLFFDADDTLFDFKKSAHHALSVTLAHFNINPPKDYYDTYQTINHAAWTAFENKEITANELRRVRFERFLAAIQEYRDPLEMNSHYLHELSRTDFLLAGARELLEELLDRGCRLCLITNGLKEVQRPRIENAGMTGYFEGIVVSDEIGVSKPDSGFFEHAFQEMNHPAKESVVVVGDSLSSDVQGGNNFGVATCWFNPSRQPNLTRHIPTYQIGRLKDLIQTLKG